MSTHSETVTRPEFQHPASIVPGVVPGTILESHEPKGVPTKEMWQYHKDHMELVSPLNRRKFKILVVGTIGFLFRIRHNRIHRLQQFAYSKLTNIRRTVIHIAALKQTVFIGIRAKTTDRKSVV